MVYLLGTDMADKPAGARFRDLLDRPGILQMPGTHNGMAALQARDAGFPALYLSGAAMTASMGLPDLGIITIEEVAFFIRQVARASGLPVLVDCDTGYGEALNVMNMVRTFEDAGAAAVHIEDQLLPKKCGHLNDKKLADARDMAAKVAAAARARRHLYLIADDLPRESAGNRFRALLERPEILRLPGAHNGQAALQAKAAGFEGLYLSGAAMTASMGLPDLGIITVDEVAFFIRQIARSSGLPLLVDGDTGYGEALNVMHMVRTFEEAGAGAVHLEDQILPKKCGHLNGKKLADAHDMAAKVAAAKKARRDIVIVARTDAAGVEGFDAAVARAKLYMEAGADAIFPEALNTREMFTTFAEAMPGVKLLANMTEFGKTPFFTAAEFEAMGYAMVIWPVSSLRVANKAQATLYAAIARDGGTHKMVDAMQTRADLYDTIGLHDYEELDASIVRTIVPEGIPRA